MTPMIDVTFLLLTFFMLTTRLASFEKSEIDLPRPDASAALDLRPVDKLIVNVQYNGDAAEPTLMLGPIRLASPAELGKRLKDFAARRPGTQVILRADRRLLYGDVRRVMQTLAASDLARLQVVVAQDRFR